MKIGYIISSLATGGAEMMLLRQVRHSDQSAVVFYLGGSEELRHSFEEAGVTVVNLNIDSIMDPTEILSVRSELAVHDLDIIHAHLPSSMVVARVAGRAAGINTIVSTHHNSEYPRGLKTVEQATRALGTHQIAVSNAVKRSQRFPLFTSEWSTIYNGIDTETFNQQVRDAIPVERFGTDSPIFLNVGRYVEQKNQTALIKAMNIVTEEFSDARAIIVGHGPLQNELAESRR